MSRGPEGWEPRPPRAPRHRGRVIPFPGPRAAPPPPARTDDPTLVEVHRCDPAEAIVVRGLFESEGIPTVMRSHVSQTVHPFSVGDQGRVEILVPQVHASRSRTLLIHLARRRTP